VLISMLLGIVIISGCSNPPKPPYIPVVDLVISPVTSLSAPMELSDNNTALFKLIVTKSDNMNTPTSFVLRFKSSNPDYFSAIEAESNTKIEEKQTEVLTQKGREFQYQFRVLGKKVNGQSMSPWTMDIEVLYNNTILKKEILYIAVK